MRILSELTLDEDKPVKLQPGDVIYTLHYLGEGYDLFWFKGKKHSDQISAREVDRGTPSSGKQIWVEKLPETEWWVRVKNAAGRVGWTEVLEDNFDSATMDACS